MEKNITQSTYGIIGYPVGHSLSPLMHNAAFAALDVEANYTILPVEPEALKSFFDDLKKKDSPIFGLNVTVPYKEKVFEYLDKFSPLAKKIGAVNTIVVEEDRKLVGYNTDAPGFLAHLQELKFDSADKRVAILGAGGSCRAIVAALCLTPQRPESIRIYNRTGSRVESLLADLQTRSDMNIVHGVETVEDLNIELCDILINTTSVGMKEEDPILVDPELLHSNILVYDLIYNPKETCLLRMARERGAQTANGLGMLYYQGVLAFQHWAAIELDESVKTRMRSALEEGMVK